MGTDYGAEPDDRSLRVPPPSQASPAIEYRRQLLLLNRERIEFSYQKALTHGLEDAIILVLDLQDDRAARLSQMVGVTWEQIAGCRRACREADVVPVHVVAMPPCTAACLGGPTTPNSPRGIAKPAPEGTFRVVAIAAGGNSFADFPLPPRSCFDLD